MHNLSTSFVLGYHGCERETGERLLQNEPFLRSENSYDWLGSGIYFWEANPDRALDWARRSIQQNIDKQETAQHPFVVGAVIDPGFCLDLLSANGIQAVEQAYSGFVDLASASGVQMPENTGGGDRIIRKLDCAVVNFLHEARKQTHQQPFDTVRAVFTEGEHLYPNSGFRRRTHIQICVRNAGNIKGVFRVPDRHFTQADI